MKTYYIKFEQVHHDAVWGMEGSGVRSSLVRVSRNRLRKAVFEWVGAGRQIEPAELAFYKRRYPLVHRVD